MVAGFLEEFPEFMPDGGLMAEPVLPVDDRSGMHEIYQRRLSISSGDVS